MDGPAEETTQAANSLRGKKDDVKYVVGESGTWDIIDYVPVIEWKIQQCPTHTAALSMRDYYNRSSELRKLEKSTCFSMTWVPVQNNLEDKSDLVKGPDIVGEFPAESRHTPLILSPDPAPLSHMAEQCRQSQDECLASYSIAVVANANSALQLSFLEGSSSKMLAAMSLSCQEAEGETMQVVADLLGTPRTAESPIWPTTFSTLESTRQLQDITTLLSLDPPTKIKSAAKKKAVSIVMVDMTRTDVDAAFEEEEEGKSMVPEAPTVPQAAGGSSPAVLDPGRTLNLQ